MKKIKYITFLLFNIFLLSIVNAESINNIDINVYLNEDGSANVTEIWNVKWTSGTEGYRAFSDLEDKSITDFKVKDDSGKTYTYQSNWNINGTFKNKAYKNGIHYTSDGLELCWGISEYGNRTYTLEYKINNLVTQYTDNQGIYFNFLELGERVNNVKITISTSFPLNLDTARIWSFGYTGNINFVEDKIVLETSSSLSAYEYMTGLIRFEEDYFNTSSNSDNSFDDVYDEATIDSDYDTSEVVSDDNSNFSFWESIGLFLLSVISMFFMFFIFAGYVLFLAFIFSKYFGSSSSSFSSLYGSKLDFGPEGKKLPDIDEINYYRDIPCNGNLLEAYYIISQYKILPLSSLKSNIIGAYFLKWLKENRIDVIEVPKKLFSKESYNLDFTKFDSSTINDDLEKKLAEIVKTAAKDNLILEQKELKKYFCKHSGMVTKWFDNIDFEIEKKYISEGIIATSTEKEKYRFFVTRYRTYTKKTVTKKFREKAIQIQGLKKFLNDFSAIETRKAEEVSLWEDYLIFAELFGIADKVREEFRKINPEFIEETKLADTICYTTIHDFSVSGYNGYRDGSSSSSSSHSYSGSSRSSGGGGGSSHSGGHSSGGSSGGGHR